MKVEKIDDPLFQSVEHSLHSIAISLKRLADLLERVEYRGAILTHNRGR